MLCQERKAKSIIQKQYAKRFSDDWHYITPCTIMKINKLMRCAFQQAIRWGMVGKNPFIGATLPKHEAKARAIWDADTIRRALDPLPVPSALGKSAA